MILSVLGAVAIPIVPGSPGKRLWLAVLVAFAGLSRPISSQEAAATAECARTAKMQVYSNAVFHKEAGDLLGYDLAITRDYGSGIKALLYIYEGGERVTGVPLTGQFERGRLLVEGNWVEHLTEYPSKKVTVRLHFVKIEGMQNSAAFRGDLFIEAFGEPERVRLRRVKRIWSCKQWSASSVH